MGGIKVGIEGDDMRVCLCLNIHLSTSGNVKRESKLWKAYSLSWAKATH